MAKKDIHQLRASDRPGKPDKTLCGLLPGDMIAAVKYPGPKEISCPACLEILRTESAKQCSGCGHLSPNSSYDSTD